MFSRASEIYFRNYLTGSGSKGAQALKGNKVFSLYIQLFWPVMMRRTKIKG